ncbi:hypothetical protein SSPIM334S_07211 [Streptomyces spiroverticillatus]
MRYPQGRGLVGGPVQGGQARIGSRPLPRSRVRASRHHLPGTPRRRHCCDIPTRGPGPGGDNRPRTGSFGPCRAPGRPPPVDRRRPGPQAARPRTAPRPAAARRKEAHDDRTAAHRRDRRRQRVPPGRRCGLGGGRRPPAGPRRYGRGPGGVRRRPRPPHRALGGRRPRAGGGRRPRPPRAPRPGAPAGTGRGPGAAPADHQFARLGAGEAVELARIMGRLPGRLVVYAVEGADGGLAPASPQPSRRRWTR